MSSCLFSDMKSTLLSIQPASREVADKYLTGDILQEQVMKKICLRWEGIEGLILCCSTATSTTTKISWGQRNNQKSVNSGCADVEMRMRFLLLKTLPFWHPEG